MNLKDTIKQPLPNPHNHNALHGLTLKHIVTTLSEHYSWEELGHRVNINCFTHEPSISSTLKFLRKHQWAREEVEHLYLAMVEQQR